MSLTSCSSSSPSQPTDGSSQTTGLGTQPLSNLELIPLEPYSTRSISPVYSFWYILLYCTQEIHSTHARVIQIRSVYRIIELAQGFDGVLFTHEGTYPFRGSRRPHIKMTNTPQFTFLYSTRPLSCWQLVSTFSSGLVRGWKRLPDGSSRTKPPTVSKGVEIICTGWTARLQSTVLEVLWCRRATLQRLCRFFSSIGSGSFCHGHLIGNIDTSQIPVGPHKNDSFG